MLSPVTFATLFLCAAPRLVCGLFTPTIPSATSVIKGNTEVILKWAYTPDKETAKDPFSSSDALCHLMWGNEGRRVTLLAYNVHPIENMVKVYIRSDYGFNSSQYYIRYRTNDSKGVAYSERFTLTDMNGLDFTLMSNSTSHGSGGSPPVDGPVKVTPSGFVSATPTTHGSPTSSAGINGATSTYAAVTELFGPFGDLPSPSGSPVPIPQSNGSSAMSLTRQKDSIWKKISLVLGPVMIGAVMAM